ncbi:metal ABC transporter permease [Haploplasma modicum]|jgi:zinc transport system permease protein|uniref:metal ABC transporter permease n=1 Tax=Haploplasma modicum TaxID=2150 RepID=UPI00214C7FA7|nr:metal ABC transporter permease [Haploplasma modicum]MCR1808971.1 metal ABC transporter permease [Haploplasma modicum]
MFEFFSYNFIINAILIASIIAVSSALLSPFLVLNEQALIADGLAHVGFTGFALGIILINEPLFISIPFVVIVSVLIKYLANNKNINGDAALGLLSTISLAIGLIIVHKSDGFNRSIQTMLVGNLWTVSNLELILSFIILILIISFVSFYYKKLLLITFDYKYAKFLKVKTNLISYLLSILTALLITIGVKAIGTLLISSFVIFPVIIGMQFKKGFFHTLLLGVIASIIAVLIGIIFAHTVDIPAGSSIILVYTIILFVSMFLKKFIKGGSFRA